MNRGGLFREPASAKRNLREEEAQVAPPAGFWRRSAAYGIDWLLLTPVMAFALRSPLGRAWDATRELDSLLQDWLLDRLVAAPGPMPSPLTLAGTLMQDPSLLASVDPLATQLSWALTQAVLLAAATAGLYFIGFEASAWQATPGKRWLGLEVVDLHGARIGWPRAALRFIAGGLSWLSLNLGHALAGWRADGRALHDLVAGTRVVMRPSVRQRAGDRPE